MDYLQLKNDNKQLNYKEIKEGKLVLKSRPLFFWFDICGMCNLQCKHCLFHMQGRTSNEDVSDRIYDIVMSELMPTAYKCNLGGTNLGESTISKKFSRFIKDCSKYKVKINLTTNGIYLNDQWLPELLENLEVIGFSMEGFDEEYEKIRGKKWSEFIANNKKIIAGKKAAKNNFQIEWRYCAHADNIHQLPEMIRIAHDIGIDRIQVMNLVPYMKEQKYKNLFYHRSSANKYFDEARKVATKLKFNINIPKNFDTGTFELTNKKNQDRTPKTIKMTNCYYPWQVCSINELGVIKPCCVYWRPMGDLRKKNFDQIWNGKKFIKLRKTINKNPMPLCYNCRRPSFDSEQSLIFTALKSGIKESLQTLVKFKKQKIEFKGVYANQSDPVK